ncbi:MAG: ABC transporter permease [Chloroflexota bacterium]
MNRPLDLPVVRPVGLRTFRPRPPAGRLIIYLVLMAGASLSVLPFAYMVASSLKSYGSVITNNLWPWWPLGDEPLQWQNYIEAVRHTGWDPHWGTWLMVRYFANSLIVSGVIVGGAVLTSLLAAYALSHVELPGRNLVFLGILATLMIPGELVLVPKVVMMFNFGWYNTYLALTVPFTVSVFGIFLLRQHFLQVPRELHDAARIDGANHLQYLLWVLLPLSRPALVVIAVLNFIWAWDAFQWPLLVTRDPSMRVLAVGLQQFMVGEGGVNTHLLMSFATMMVVPIIGLYFVAQRAFTEGFLSSGIKR